ncbi:MAG: rRNA maturation RNase YbeY [Chloroflexi bacterium]|nr:rRNA maturation RNase YbeY [Chloroflexota bacterium]
MEINVLIDEAYKKQLKPAWLKGAIRQILEEEQVSANSEVGLVIIGDEKIHELNKQYLEEDRPTDVLSFPMSEQIRNQPVFVSAPDGKMHLGEVIISYPQASQQAEEHSHPVKREVLLLLIHGVLHLLGYDHDIPERESLMCSREAAILRIIEEHGL